MKNTAPIGVIVGRFQVPNIHDGHKALFDEVAARHERLIIFVGVHPFPATKSCPLDYATRAFMLSARMAMIWSPSTIAPATTVP